MPLDRCWEVEQWGLKIYIVFLVNKINLSVLFFIGKTDFITLYQVLIKDNFLMSTYLFEFLSAKAKIRHPLRVLQRRSSINQNDNREQIQTSNWENQWTEHSCCNFENEIQNIVISDFTYSWKCNFSKKRTRNCFEIVSIIMYLWLLIIFNPLKE